MTFEEMERTMQFILEQQAQLTVKQSKAEERMDRFEETQQNIARQIEHLGRALVELTEAHARTQVALTQLAESQTRSDRKLEALIDIVRGGRDTGQ